MYVAHVVKGGQRNDCDGTSWYTDRANAAAEGLSKSKDFSSTVRPAVPKDLVCESVRTCSLRDEFAPYEMSPSCRMDFPPSREVGRGSDEKGSSHREHVGDGFPFVGCGKPRR